MHDKKELLRVVRSSDGTVCFDFSGRLPGRGAYLCAQEECLRKARKLRALERAFGTEIGESVYDALEKELEVRRG